MKKRRLSAFVEALLRNRRPKKFTAESDDADAMGAAIELRASQAEEASPRPEFVADLHHQLARHLGAETAPGDQLSIRRVSRRRLLEGVGIAAAAVTAGVILDREVLDTGGPTTSNTQQPLVPDHGTWQPVVATSDLGNGQVAPFQTASTVGFVVNKGGTVQAVSGICTHQGCLLRQNPTAARLECPCHRASFSLDGKLISHELSQPPPPLPQLSVRERDGQVEVYTPPPV
jgi:nitrite reductase/ring-hydroxylating ferredoxin subunit